MLGTAFAALLGSFVGGGHCGMQGREVAHHTLISVLLIGMNGLRMLAEIVEARKLLSTMTSERTFASVLPESRWWMDGRKGWVVSQGRDEERTEEGQGTRT